MSSIYRRKEVVEVMFVTDETFDAPHPNEDHMTGLLFDPRTRTVRLDNPCEEDDRIARVGDVIVRHEGRWDSIWDADMFTNGFEEVPPRDKYCLECSEAAEHNSICVRASEASVYHIDPKES